MGFIVVAVKVNIANLQAGQEVGIVNCVTLGKIIRRTGKNQYLVDWKGSQLLLSRNQLTVRSPDGRFVSFLAR
jgi:hypothetical protein